MVVYCITCNSAITPTIPGIKCNSCTNHYHIKCVGIDKSQYDAFKSLSGACWKCDDCLSTKSDTRPCNCCKLLPSLLDTIKNLSETVDALKQQITNLTSNLPKNDSNYDYESMVQEVTERQKRKTNIILYNMPEQDPSLNNETRKNKEAELVSDFLKLLQHDSGNERSSIPELISTPIRLGKYVTNKIRPIKLTLKEEKDVFNLLGLIKRKRRNIDAVPHFKSVHASSDKTDKQRLYYKELLNQITNRREKGELDLFIKYIRGVPTIQKKPSLN